MLCRTRSLSSVSCSCFSQVTLVCSSNPRHAARAAHASDLAQSKSTLKRQGQAFAEVKAGLRHKRNVLTPRGLVEDSSPGPTPGERRAPSSLSPSADLQGLPAGPPEKPAVPGWPRIPERAKRENNFSKLISCVIEDRKCFPPADSG